MENQAKARKLESRNLARATLKRAGISSPPVMLNDVVNHVKMHFDLTVMSADLGAKVDGVHVMDGESVTIGYNKSHPRHRQRFTVAHELGHLLLGHTAPGAIYIDPSSNKPEEIEANTFAGELLVPLTMLKAHRGKSAHDLAVLFDVSEEVIWIQLLQYKLV